MARRLGIKLDEQSPAKKRKSCTCANSEEDSRPTADSNLEWVQKLTDLITCPVCYELITPPTKVCLNGHSTCGRCRIQLKKCPLCCECFSSAKNNMLAQIADMIKYPCPNEPGGCPVTTYLRLQKQHLKVCKFWVHHCKVDNCRWSGKRSELITHVEGSHVDVVWRKDWTFAGSRKFEFNNDSPDEFVKLVVIRDYLFWMLSYYDSANKKLHKAFQYVGSEETAKLFTFELIIKNPDDNREIMFKFPVSNDQKFKSDTFESPNCAIIDFKTLRSLSTKEERKIKYTYTIYKN